MANKVPFWKNREWRRRAWFHAMPFVVASVLGFPFAYMAWLYGANAYVGCVFGFLLVLLMIHLLDRIV